MKALAATWRFSEAGVVAAARVLTEGGSALDAAEEGVRVVEFDESVTSVGYGGLPDERGELSLDAALMTGCGRIGSVMALEGYRSAAGISRLVLERSDHAQLAGEGAEAFARVHGVLRQEELLTPHAKSRYAEWRNGKVETVSGGHTDTVGVLAIDGNGGMAAGCATSGMQFKTHGRVGDSPIVGSGLYVMDGVGAAAATGDGDRMVRHCIAVRVVDMMETGVNGNDACMKVVRRVAESDTSCQAAVVALDKNGKAAGASTHRGFYVVYWDDETKNTRAFEAAAVSEQHWQHSCV